jgi:flagellin-like hook-associated protein FlgL
MTRIVNLSATSILHGYAFNNFQKKLNTAQYQAATGNKLEYSSDDPLLAQKLQYLQNSIGKNQQIQSNFLVANQRLEELSTLLGSSEGADGILGILNDIRDLMRTNLAPTDTAGVAARRSELRALTTQLVDTLNQRAGDDNRYLFGGTISDQKPFNLDLSSTPLSIQYVGNYDLASMNISDSIQESLTMVGASLVGASSSFTGTTLPANANILQSIAYYDNLLSNPTVSGVSSLTAGNAYQSDLYNIPPFGSQAPSSALASGSLTFNFNMTIPPSTSPASVPIVLNVVGIQNDADFTAAIQNAIQSTGISGISLTASIDNGVIKFSYPEAASVSLTSVTASYQYVGAAPITNSDITGKLGFKKNQYAQNDGFNQAMAEIQTTFQNGQNSVISVASQVGFRQKELESIANLSENLGLQYKEQYRDMGKVDPALANAQYMSLLNIYHQILAVSAKVGQSTLFNYL